MTYSHPFRNDDPAAKRLRKQAGEWLQGLRSDAGLTQKDVAKYVGYEYYTMVSQVENGATRIPPQHYEKWARVLKQDPQEFVKRLMSFYDPLTYKVLFGSSKK